MKKCCLRRLVYPAIFYAHDSTAGAPLIYFSIMPINDGIFALPNDVWQIERRWIEIGFPRKLE